MSEPESTVESIRSSIEKAIIDARVEVTAGSPGHFSVVVVSTVFTGKSTLESQRLVYSAIAPLMAGSSAPVHAIDNMKTRVA
jgi:acid stress-induced BolA-like protein IbaG/YrbA